MKAAILTCSFLLSLMAGSSEAHHSISAMYARENGITIEGVVTRFEFINPHAIVHLEVTTKEGARENWTIEWSSRNRLSARGYTDDTLKTGDRIQVTGGPARDGSKGMFVGRLVRPADGFEYISAQAGAAIR